jgi:peptidyl-dipeptidase Dcp
VQTDSTPNPVWDFITEKVDLRLPDFSSFTPELLADAADRVVQYQQRRIEAILDSTEDPDFPNTTLGVGWACYPAFRLTALVRVLQANVLTDELADTLAEVSAVLTSARLDSRLDAELFARLEAVPTNRLNPEDKRHHELLLEDFVRTGVRLDAESRSRVAAITAEIERLQTEFTGLLPREAKDLALHVSDAEALAGLSRSALSAAARRAAGRGLQGYVVSLDNTTQQSALAHLTNPAVRESLLAQSMQRGSRGGPGDVREIVSDLTALRAALADLLGYKSYSDYAIDNQTAGNPDEAGDLLADLIAPTQTRLAEEVALIRRRYGLAEVRSADLLHYLNRLTADTFAFDPDELSKFFEFDRVLHEGVFYAATALYGIEFTELPEARGWHPDVRVFAAHEDDQTVGLICVDPYERDTKGGGAWMDQLISPARLTGERPITTMSLNLSAPGPGEPTLLTLEETATLFHEFGHVLHALVSDVTYPSLAGTAVPRDYVEFPSQLNEVWAFHRRVLPNYAVHVETGEGLADELADRIRQAQTFGQGLATAEYLAAALLDLGWHSLEAGEQVDDVLSFEDAVLSAAGLDPLVPPRYRSTYFAHVFSGDYAAGYYSYVWAEVFAAHAAEWFESQGGLSPEAGQAFRENVLARGNSADPLAVFTDFFDGGPKTGALLRRRGLAPRAEAGPAQSEPNQAPAAPASAGPEPDPAQSSPTSAAWESDPGPAADSRDHQQQEGTE